MPATNLEGVNISASYGGLLHAGGEPIPSSGQWPILDGKGTPTALKLGAYCNGATICGTLSATTLKAKSLILEDPIPTPQIDIKAIVDAMFPVNSVIYIQGSSNPKSRSGWGHTNWEQIAEGRFIVGTGTGGTDSNGIKKTFSLGENYGEYDHILTEPEMPGHTHSLKVEGEQFYITNDGNDKSPTSLGRFRSDGPSGSNDGRYCNTLPSTGGSKAHNNIPPGYGLAVWRRTS